jgi:hypothetical protein
MTPGEARKLLGGYATRTLTDDERIALFEAALSDQGLFEELIQEQTIQEVMDDPVSRAGLLAALGASKPKRAWWKVWWVPAGAIAVAACLTVGFLLTWNSRRPPEMASIERQMVAPSMISQPAPAPAEKKMPRAHKKAALAGSASPPPASLSRVEVQAQSAAVVATPMAALAPNPRESQKFKATQTSALRLTLVQPSGVIHPGDEVSVTATAESAGFLYVYEREGAGPWTLLGGPQGLDMTPGQNRPLPTIRIPDGIARVTLVAFLTPEQEAPPNPDQIVPDGFKTELVLDVIQK